MKNPSVFRTAFVIVILVFAGTWLFISQQPKNDREQAEKQVNAIDVAFAGNKSRTIHLAIDGTVESRHVVDIAFEVGGKLEKGQVLPEPGMTFKKGQLLYQINNREAFAGLTHDKARLATLILQTLPEIEAAFPDEKNKWVRFMEELKPQFLLPELPKFSSSKERYLITEKGILSTFYQLQHSEVAMTRHFYLAPFDGIVLSVSEYPGNVVAPRQRIAKIGTENTFHIMAKVPRDYLETFGLRKEVHICLPNGDTAGKARFVSRSTVMETSPTRYYFEAEWEKARKLYHGMPVRLAAIHRDYTKSCRVPVSAVDGDLIQLVQNGKLITRRIDVIGREGDTLFISGLENGDAYAVHYLFHPDPSVKYYPKKR
jgi:membrane fusion protein (multidrug efflux system)